MEEQSVVVLKNYGKIEFHIQEWMDARGMTKGALARLANVRYEVAKKWYQGDVERMDMDVLARICFALNCELSDILTYEK